jgi:hypothetical protein
MHSALDAALRYADSGWLVFPCRADKTPHTEHGFLDASADPDQIDRWWRRWPDAQVGVACGMSGICAIDLDLKPSENKDGIAAFSRLVVERGNSEHGCLLIASTPRGGRHYLYRLPGDGVKTTTDLLPDSGIDVRATGGYIIVPSPTSPGREWVLGDPHSRNDLAELPHWLRDLLEPRTIVGERRIAHRGLVVPIDAAELARIRSALPWVCNDERKTWIRVGMALKSLGAGEQGFDLWCEWASTTEHSKIYGTATSHRIHPKFDHNTHVKQWDSLAEYFDDGSEVTIASLYFLAQDSGWPGLGPQISVESTAPEDTEPTPNSEPFPTALLDCPGLVGDVAQWMIRISPRPQPALCLASTITTLGALLGRRVRTLSNLRTNIYALGIGETGCGKDPSIKLPVALLGHAGLERFIGAGEWKSDSGLRAALLHEPSHVCLIDEFTKVLRTLSGDRIPPHLNGIKRYLLEMFTGAGSAHLAPAYADRKVNAPIVIIEPNLCVYGVGVPSDLFGALDRGALQDGFLNRFLLFFVDEDRPTRQRTEADAIPPEDITRRMRALDARLSEGVKNAGNLAGKTATPGSGTGCRTVPMLPQAIDFVDEIESDIDRKVKRWRKDGNPIAVLWNRFAEHVQKIALIRTVADDRAREIGVQDIAWALELVTWCLNRTHRLAEAHVSDSQTEADTKRVLRLVVAAGEIGLTANQIARRTQWLRRGDRKDILQTLVESGQVLAITSGTPQHPSTTYRALRGGV